MVVRWTWDVIVGWTWDVMWDVMCLRHKAGSHAVSLRVLAQVLRGHRQQY